MGPRFKESNVHFKCEKHLCCANGGAGMNWLALNHRWCKTVRKSTVRQKLESKLLEFVSIIHCRKRDPVLNGLLTSEGKQLIEAGLFKEYVRWALIWCWLWICNVAKKKYENWSHVDWPAVLPAGATKEGGPGIEDIAAPQPLNWWQFN